MSSQTWRILDEIGAKASGPSSEIAAMLSAAMELVADVLPIADGRELSDGALAAAHALTLLMAGGRNPVNRESSDFHAGRLSAIIDILAYASAVTAVDDDVAKARAELCSRIIGTLKDGPLVTEDIAERAQLDAGTVAEGLAELHRIGMVASQMHGTERYNVLAPVGALLAAER